MKLFFLCILISVACYPQWQLVNPKITLTSIVDIVRTDNKIIMINNAGDVFLSYDTLKTWINPTSLGEEIIRVQFIDSLNGWARPRSYGNYYFQTIDGGYSWDKVKAIENINLINLFFANDQVGFLCTYPYQIHRTSNGGRTWIQMDTMFNNYTSNFATNGSKIFFSMNFKLYSSSDLGLSWIINELPRGETTNGYSDIYFMDSLLGYMTSDQYQVLKTNDGGNTWVSIKEESINHFYFQDAAYTANTIFLIQNARLYDKYNSKDVGDLAWGYLYRSTDDGISWENTFLNKKSKYAFPAQHVVAFNDSTFIFTGNNGIINITHDKGESFKDLNHSNFIYSIDGYRFFNDNFGIIAADSIYKTYDGGNTFSSIYPSIFPDWYAIKAVFPDSNTIVIATDSSYIAKSIDQGKTWKKIPVSVPMKQPIHEIKFVNDTLGYFITDGHICKTTNKGETWNPISNGGYDIEVTDENNIWLTSGGLIIHSSDGGINWESQGSHGVNFIAFADNQYGIAANRIPKYTINGGRTWNNSILQGLSGSDELMELVYCKIDNILFGYAAYDELGYTSSSKKNYYSIDSGKTWIRDIDTPGYLYNFSLTGHTLWASDITRGFLIKRNDFATLTSVKDNEDIPVYDYNLSQNYPNPFNPSTTIEFSIPKDGLYKVKIYNILGQEITTLINTELKQGIHKATFDGTKLSSGIYFYQLQGMDVNITKKMVLAK